MAQYFTFLLQRPLCRLWYDALEIFLSIVVSLVILNVGWPGSISGIFGKVNCVIRLVIGGTGSL